MQKWEYRIVSTELDWDEESDKLFGIDKGRLSQLGNEGWEMVGIAPVNGPLGDRTNCTVEIQYIFKRPKPAEAVKPAPITVKAASRIQSTGDSSPESKTAKSGFAECAQSAAAKMSFSNGKR